MKNKCENCGLCCLDTEMILSKEEVDNYQEILKDLKPNQLVKLNDEGFYQMLNMDGHCVFYAPKENLCKQYEMRPMGCRLYPLIFDPDSKECIFDDECPRPEAFYKNEQEIQEACIKLKKYIKEKFSIEIE